MTCWCAAQTAAAEETPSPAAPPATEPNTVTPTTPEEREQRAAQLFRDAEARYEAADVEGAYQLMRSAYELSGRFELLFNLGQLERELLRCTQARHHYEAYLVQAPAGPRRDQVQRFQLELAGECPEPPAVATSARGLAQMQQAPEHQPRHRGITPLRIAGWSTLGGTLVAGVAATYFSLEASRQEERLEARIRNARGADAKSRGFSQADKELEEDGQHAANWARGLTVGAVGLAAIGVSLLLIDGSNAASDSNASFSLGWRSGAASAEYSGSF